MKSNDYQYSLAQCDVPEARRSKLEIVPRRKRLRWLTWLDADTPPALDDPVIDGLDRHFLWDFAEACRGPRNDERGHLPPTIR